MQKLTVCQRKEKRKIKKTVSKNHSEYKVSLEHFIQMFLL